MRPIQRLGKSHELHGRIQELRTPSSRNVVPPYFVPLSSFLCAPQPSATFGVIASSLARKIPGSAPGTSGTIQLALAVFRSSLAAHHRSVILNLFIKSVYCKRIRGSNKSICQRTYYIRGINITICSQVLQDSSWISSRAPTRVYRLITRVAALSGIACKVR